MKKNSRNSALSNGVSGTSNSDESSDEAPGIQAKTIAVNAAPIAGAPASISSSGDVATQDVETQIESRLVTRVLVLTSPETNSTPLDSTQTHARWSATLAQAGHQVSWTERDAWKPDALDPCGDMAPEVILFETSEADFEMESVARLCSQIKSSGASHCTALLVALPVVASSAKASDGEKTEPNGANEDASTNEIAVVARLQESGADDFIIGGSDRELLARVGVLARLARVRHELEATREHLRMQIQLDDLTHLLNRRFFFQAAHREYGRARRYNHDLSCLMLDVNGFKQINAAFGFECGDALLRQIATVLRDCTRDCDVLARWAEDKFVLLLPETPLEGAITLRENIAREVGAQTFHWHGHDLPMSVSIGEAARRLTRAAQVSVGDHAVEFGADFGEADQPEVVSVSLREEMAGLLEEADAALYVAKRGVRYQALPGTQSSQITSASTQNTAA